MKAIPAWLKRILYSVILLLLAGNAYASHVVGVDLFYTWQSGNTYKITLIVYGDCGPASATAFGTLSSAAPHICVYDGNTNVGSTDLTIQAPTAGVEITPVCPADISLTQCTNTSFTIPGIKKFVYTGTYTVPYTSATWRFVYLGYMGAGASGSGRAAAITNITSGSVIQVEDTLNNTVYHNSSPLLTIVPTPFFCLDNTDNYNPGAVDPDGDSLTFFLVPGIDASAALAASPSSPTCAPLGVSVSYTFPYTATAPLATTSFSFDPTNGQISFYPNALQRSLVVYNIEEHRAGAFVGTSQREMTFLVLTCTNVAASGGLTGATSGVIEDSTHFEICQNSGTFSININPTEPVATNNITVTYGGLPTGATFTIAGNGTPTPHCTFSWNSTGVTPGTYTFYVTYTDNNCPLAGVQTLAYTIVILPSPTITYSLLSAATCTKKAAISIIPGGGGASWIIKVSSAPGDTIQAWAYHGPAFTDSLSPGTYTITIYTNPNHCLAYVSFTIASPVAIVPTATFTNPTYCGATDGTIKLYHLPAGTIDTIKFTYNGVLQPVRVLTVAADSTVLLSGLAAGVYSNITATYGLCVSNTVGPVTLANPAFTMRALSFINPSWCGVCDGSVTLYGLHPGQIDTITYLHGGGTGGPYAQLVGADSTITIPALCQGAYINFVAKTAGTCVSNTLGPANLVAPPFTMRAITFTDPSYCGVCDGTITLYGLHPGQTDTITYYHDGGLAPQVVRTIGADSTVTITGLCSGIYLNFVAKTAGICVSNTLGPVTLAVPPFTMRAISYTNPDYCGVCNGTITLYGLHPGELDTINYTKDGVAQTPVIATIPADSIVVITGLCAGVYNNFVANTGGICVSNTLGPVTLVVPPFTMRAISHTNPDYCGICNGTITLYGLHPGELDTINYTMGGVAQPPVIQTIPADSMVVITGLCAGAYDNFIAHTGGVCVSNTLGPVTLTVPPFTMRAVSHRDPDYCGTCNGTITLYGLHPGQLDTITYTMGGTAQPPVITTIPADSMVTISGLCAGTYDNFIAHTGGVCVSNTLGPVVLTVPPFTVRSLTFTNPDYCGICNGTVTLYGLHPGQLDTINYTKDGVAQTPVIATIPADSMVIITGLCAGVYNNFIANTGGVCISNTLGPADLVVPPFTMRALTFTNPAFCGICNGTITLYGLHPGQIDTINYTYNGTAQPPVIATIPADSMVQLTGLCFGTYDNFVANTGGVCISNTLGPADLVVPPFIIRADSFKNPTKCGFCDGSIKLYGLYPGQTDTITYSFNGVAQPGGADLVGTDSTINLAGLCEGIYANIVANTGGVCVSNALGPDTLVAPPIIDSFTYMVYLGCKGDTVVFTNHSTPASDLTYTWSFGDGTTSTEANPVHIYYTPGTVNVRLIITNTRCVDTSTQSITFDNLIIAGFTTVPDSFLCQGSPVTFTNTSLGTSLSYNWYFGDGNTATTANAVHVYPDQGTYNIVLVVTNYIPCTDTAYHTIAVDSMSAISILATDSVLCGGHDVTFTGIYSTFGNTGVTWTFSDGEGAVQNANPVVHAFAAGGVYTVSVEAFYRACPDTSASKQVRVYGYPTVDLGPDTSICAGSVSLTLFDNINAGNPAATWLWNNGGTTPEMLVTEPGNYYVTVSIDGCEATDSVNVQSGCYLDIPNAFTPNGDGINDYFLPRPLLAKGLASFTMNIYNRWGQLIFETTNIEGRGWDGRFNAVMQPEGVYVYVIEATFIDGQKEHHQGNLTLLK